MLFAVERPERFAGVKFAGVAGQYGIFAASYGIALAHSLRPVSQICVVGEGKDADRLFTQAWAQYLAGKSVLRFKPDQMEPQNLPPALAGSLPALQDRSTAPRTS